MIRADELMLGDWVSVEGIPRQVEAITKKKIGYHKDKQNDGRLYYARLCEVEPIPLAESNLVRNTFFRLEGEMCDTYCHLQGIRLLHYHKATDKKFVLTINRLGWGVEMPLFTVSELQHYLRLFSIEIDWKF